MKGTPWNTAWRYRLLFHYLLISYFLLFSVLSLRFPTSFLWSYTFVFLLPAWFFFKICWHLSCVFASLFLSSFISFVVFVFLSLYVCSIVILILVVMRWLSKQRFRQIHISQRSVPLVFTENQTDSCKRWQVTAIGNRSEQMLLCIFGAVRRFEVAFVNTHIVQFCFDLCWTALRRNQNKF